MNRVGSHQGYTIVETLIFLAVTGALFTSAMLLVSGQQAKTEFTQGIRDIQSHIQDVGNDVATGYYNNAQQFKCSNSSGQPHITNFGGDTQGTNEDCIFIGRAIQFGPLPASNPDRYKVYNVVGLRAIAGQDVSNYAQAIPTPMAPGNPPNNRPDDSETNTLQGGITVKYVQFEHGGAIKNIAGFAFMSTLAQYSLGVVASGSQNVDIIPIKDVGAGNGPAETDLDFADDIYGFSSSTLQKDPDGGIIICFDSTSTNEHAVMTFGINRGLTPHVDILPGQSALDPVTGKCI